MGKSIWIPFPPKVPGENKKYLKPPPSTRPAVFFSIETIVGVISYLFFVYAGSKTVGTGFLFTFELVISNLGFFSLLTIARSQQFLVQFISLFFCRFGRIVFFLISAASMEQIRCSTCATVTLDDVTSAHGSHETC